MYLREFNGVRLLLAHELSATRYVVVGDVDRVEDQAARFLEPQETPQETGEMGSRGASPCKLLYSHVCESLLFLSVPPYLSAPSYLSVSLSLALFLLRISPWVSPPHHLPLSVLSTRTRPTSFATFRFAVSHKTPLSITMNIILLTLTPSLPPATSTALSIVPGKYIPLVAIRTTHEDLSWICLCLKSRAGGN